MESTFGEKTPSNELSERVRDLFFKITMLLCLRQIPSSDLWPQLVCTTPNPLKEYCHEALLTTPHPLYWPFLRIFPVNLWYHLNLSLDSAWWEKVCGICFFDFGSVEVLAYKDVHCSTVHKNHIIESAWKHITRPKHWEIPRNLCPYLHLDVASLRNFYLL